MRRADWKHHPLVFKRNNDSRVMAYQWNPGVCSRLPNVSFAILHVLTKLHCCQPPGICLRSHESERRLDDLGSYVTVMCTHSLPKILAEILDGFVAIRLCCAPEERHGALVVSAAIAKGHVLEVI